MPRVVRTADVVWEGNVARGSGAISAGTGAFSSLPYSLPARVGAPEGKTSPEELLAAAHAGCFAMSLAGELAGRDTPGRVSVTAAVTLDEVAGKGHQIVRSEVTGTVEAVGLTAAALADAARAADEGCPFSALIRASAEVTVDVRLA
ncbi:MAG: OsmC family peroxiredoxin [Gaiellaceae bacterium]